LITARDVTASYARGIRPNPGAAKQELRNKIWSLLESQGIAAYPGAHGRIPNFIGAGGAAERLAALPIWRRALTVAATPDLPQLPVREWALRDGKVVYMEVPRLSGPAPFLEIDPVTVPPAKAAWAASLDGAYACGHFVRPIAMRPVDLVVVGSVAVSRDGARLGKGGGFSDRGYALIREAQLASASVPVATTVHEAQIVEPYRIPMLAHDLWVDAIVTPRRILCTSPSRRGRACFKSAE
jgi:5-formyltetrahydrofolate cyclo-ligase